MSKLTGSCLCGAVQYEIANPLRFARNCHCTMCRKATGAAFATWAYVEYRDFRWIHGSDLLGEYRSSPDVSRTFCKVCGSTLQYIADQAFPDAFGLALGTVNGDPQAVNRCATSWSAQKRRGLQSPTICLSQRKLHLVNNASTQSILICR